MGKQVAARLKQNNFNIPNGGVAQLGEHLPCKQGVKGSNPFISTIAMSDNCTGDQARCKFTCMRARATGQLVRST